MEILARGDQWVAIHKRAGDHVHPPENKLFKVPREQVVLYRLRNHLRRHVYPVHRLDAATSGVLLMALTPEAASFIAKQFQERRTRKIYHAVVRGWPEPAGRIDRPLASDSTGEIVDAVTEFKRLDHIELERLPGEEYPRRYALLELEPLTGRFHQIRRHLNRLAHPIIGDGEHGDYRHNRFFREKLGLSGLCLKAQTLGFFRPEDGQWIEISAPDSEAWSALRALFQTHSSRSSPEPAPESAPPGSSLPKSPNSSTSSAAPLLP